MKRMRSNSILVLVLAVFTLPVMADESWTLSAAEWSRPRTGERVRNLEPVNAAINALLADQDNRLLLHHSTDEDGSLWASELKDWLVALGVAPHRIEIMPGGASSGELELEVETP